VSQSPGQPHDQAPGASEAKAGVDPIVPAAERADGAAEDDSEQLPGGESAELLGADGAFAAAIDGFAPREAQQRLAAAVESAIADGAALIGEAGTGVGKTFAYLVPALLCGKKVIVSTGTRHLQDQLFLKDLPRVRDVLGVPLHAALLKGRANYLCRHRLRHARGNPALRDPVLQSQLGTIDAWAAKTRSGDISEVAEIPESAMVWQYVTSNSDFCAEHERDELDDCFVHAARREAQEADLVVVNHHLFLADLAIKEEGYGEVLPSADALILDEAHQLPETAGNFFGERFTSRQLIELARDTIGEQLRDAADAVDLRFAAEGLENASRDLRLAFGVEPRRASWGEVEGDDKLQRALGKLLLAYDELLAQLEPNAARGKGLESCQRRAREQAALLGRFHDASETGTVYWFETYRTGYALSLTPLDVAAPFRKAMAGLPAAWVFTSATLSVGGEFAHFRARLGLPREAREVLLDSPFDYRHNALLYVPQEMPEPNSPGYTRAVLEAALPLIRAAGGRAFLLFTSHRALREAADWLLDRLDLPTFVQGDKPKRELLASFAESGNGVLLGTHSFWEGVDVRGEALQLVVIDKLPFASPGDPVLAARMQAMQRQNLSPFFHYQIPQAVIALKQGAGRLIRDVDDRGVLMLCDPRLISRGYGRVFIHSLPGMSRTRRADTVQRFFARLRQPAGDDPADRHPAIDASATASDVDAHPDQETER